MKKYFEMLRFVLIMAVLTSGIFIGMEAWTGPLIEANASIELQSIILNANGISFTTGNINQVFAEEIEVFSDNDKIIYRSRTTGNVSYEFSGGGVWGPIIGIITLQPDLRTIQQIRIVQQEETPGLGGVVASIPYLTKFEGIQFTPSIQVNIPDGNPNQVNEVDSITGATRTSKAFEGILNTSYEAALPILERVGR
jgi:Na+-transporting NADH:ubiquinone oxidoreductase subunit C